MQMLSPFRSFVTRNAAEALGCRMLSSSSFLDACGASQRLRKGRNARFTSYRTSLHSQLRFYASSQSSSSSSSSSDQKDQQQQRRSEPSQTESFIYYALTTVGVVYLCRNLWLWLQWPGVGDLAIDEASKAPLIQKVVGLPLTVHKLSWGGTVHEGASAHMTIPVTGSSGMKAVLYCKAFFVPQTKVWEIVALQARLEGTHQFIDVLEPVREDALSAVVNSRLIAENNEKVEKYIVEQQKQAA